MELIAVGFGCALGAVCRYLLENGLNTWTMDPISILVINCMGCFLMGLFTAIIERREPSKIMAKFMTTGFCGGLTTFSTFSADTYKLLQTNALAGDRASAGESVPRHIAVYSGSQAPAG